MQTTCNYPLTGYKIIDYIQNQIISSKTDPCEIDTQGFFFFEPFVCCYIAIPFIEKKLIEINKAQYEQILDIKYMVNCFFADFNKIKLVSNKDEPDEKFHTTRS